MPRGRPKRTEEPEHENIEVTQETTQTPELKAEEDDLLNEKSATDHYDPMNPLTTQGEDLGSQYTQTKQPEPRKDQYHNQDAFSQNYRRPSPPSESIAIFNLNDQTDESDIRTLVEPFGAVDDINMVKNHTTNRFRGFCFVRFTSLENAKAAIAGLEGMTLKGNPIRVDYCLDKRANSYNRSRSFNSGFRGRREYDRGGSDYYSKPKRFEYTGYRDRNEGDEREGGYSRGYRDHGRGRGNFGYGRRFEDREYKPRPRYDRDQHYEREGGYSRNRNYDDRCRDRDNGGYRREERGYGRDYESRGRRDEGYGDRGYRGREERDERPERPEAKNSYEMRYNRGGRDGEDYERRF